MNNFIFSLKIPHSIPYVYMPTFLLSVEGYLGPPPFPSYCDYDQVAAMTKAEQASAE